MWVDAEEFLGEFYWGEGMEMGWWTGEEGSLPSHWTTFLRDVGREAGRMLPTAISTT